MLPPTVKRRIWNSVSKEFGYIENDFQALWKSIAIRSPFSDAGVQHSTFYFYQTQKRFLYRILCGNSIAMSMLLAGWSRGKIKPKDLKLNKSCLRSLVALSGNIRWSNEYRNHTNKMLYFWLNIISVHWDFCQFLLPASLSPESLSILSSRWNWARQKFIKLISEA